MRGVAKAGAVALLASGLAGCGGGDETMPAPSAPRPEITSWSPRAGPEGGGTEVKFEGTALVADGAAVSFGGEPATSLESPSDQVLLAMTPAHDPATVDVRLLISGTEIVLPDAFEFLAELTSLEITSLSPDQGPTEGGTQVLLEGSGLLPDASVQIGGADATDVLVLDESHVAFLTPPGSIGPADVVVKNVDGGEATLPAGFDYVDAVDCTVGSITPSFGAKGVDVTAGIDIAWSEPVDAASVGGAVQLETLDGSAVPFTIEAVDARTHRLVPAHSLHFWETYVASVGQVTAAGGAPCAAASSVFSTREPIPAPRNPVPAGVEHMAVVGGYLYATHQALEGLQIHDLSDPAAPALVGEVDLAVPTNHVVPCDANLLLVPAGPDGVRILDTSQPEQPVEIGYVPTSGHAIDAACFDDGSTRFAVVADGTQGIVVHDLSDPLAPTFVASSVQVVPPAMADGDAQALDLEASLLAVANGAGGISLISLASPASPALLATIPAAGRSVVDVLLDGTTLYASWGYYGLRSFDVTDPAAPVALGQAFGPGGDCTVGCIDYFTALTRTSGGLRVALGLAGSALFTLGPAGTMTLAGSLDPQGRTEVVLETAGQLHLGGTYGLYTFVPGATGNAAPISEPATPPSVPRSLRIADGYAYVGGGWGGVQTFDLTDRLSPEYRSRVVTPGAASNGFGAMFALPSGDVLYVGDGAGGFTVLDRADPAVPVALGGAVPPNDLLFRVEVAANGTTVYSCADSKGFLSIDASNPAAPSQLANLSFTETQYCADLELIGDTLLVSTNQHLLVADVADPSAPTWIGSLTVPGNDGIGQLTRRGDHVYAITQRPDAEQPAGVASRLRVFDVADPTDPQLVGSTDPLSLRGRLVVRGDVGFCPTTSGVRVFDLSQSQAPLDEGEIPLVGDLRDLDVTGDTVYVAMGQGGIQPIDVGVLPGQ